RWKAASRMAQSGILIPSRRIRHKGRLERSLLRRSRYSSRMNSDSSYKYWPRRGAIPVRFRHCRFESKRRRFGSASENRLNKRIVIHIIVAVWLCASPSQTAEPQRTEPENTLPGLNGPVPRAQEPGARSWAVEALIDHTLWVPVGGGQW